MKQPLAFRVRPTTLDEVIGQEHLIGANKPLRKCVEAKQVFSMIFYGPPGCGKTTLAMVIANELKLPYRLFNAVTGNKKDLDAIFLEAKLSNGLIVIIDEVHRLNKDKQDLLLPYVENGLITLIGATTSNPYHAINPAIRSRTHLFEIKALTSDGIYQTLVNALNHPNGLNNEYQYEEEALHKIANVSNGDVRYALNILELCCIASDTTLTIDLVNQFISTPNYGIDHDEDGHYDLLSAFQKSIRGSDVDAALYYLGLLIQANDMDSIERRLITTAYEDIGLANPSACARCVQAIDAAKRIGFPEARIPLSVAIIDLCLSPKSKSGEAGIDNALQAIRNHPAQIPDYLRYTPVNKDPEDVYDYTRSDLWPYIQYLPNSLRNENFYQPELTSSYEKVLANNLAKLKQHKRYNNLRELKAKFKK